MSSLEQYFDRKIEERTNDLQRLLRTTNMVIASDAKTEQLVNMLDVSVGQLLISADQLESSLRDLVLPDTSILESSLSVSLGVLQSTYGLGVTALSQVQARVDTIETSAGLLSVSLVQLIADSKIFAGLDLSVAKLDSCVTTLGDRVSGVYAGIADTCGLVSTTLDPLWEAIVNFQVSTNNQIDSDLGLLDSSIALQQGKILALNVSAGSLTGQVSQLTNNLVDLQTNSLLLSGTAEMDLRSILALDSSLGALPVTLGTLTLGVGLDTGQLDVSYTAMDQSVGQLNTSLSLYHNRVGLLGVSLNQFEVNVDSLTVNSHLAKRLTGPLDSSLARVTVSLGIVRGILCDGYYRKVETGLIPTMLSDDTQDGFTVSASSNARGAYEPFRAVDGNINSEWFIDTEVDSQPHWWKIQLPQAKALHKVIVRHGIVGKVTSYTLYGNNIDSNDDGTWQAITTVTTNFTPNALQHTAELTPDITKTYLYYKIALDAYDSYPGFSTIQFYALEPVTAVESYLDQVTVSANTIQQSLDILGVSAGRQEYNINSLNSSMALLSVDTARLDLSFGLLHANNLIRNASASALQDNNVAMTVSLASLSRLQTGLSVSLGSLIVMTGGVNTSLGISQSGVSSLAPLQLGKGLLDTSIAVSQSGVSALNVSFGQMLNGVSLLNVSATSIQTSVSSLNSSSEILRNRLVALDNSVSVLEQTYIPAITTYINNINTLGECRFCGVPLVVNYAAGILYNGGVSRTGTGQYNLSFMKVLPDASYSVYITASNSNTLGGARLVHLDATAGYSIRALQFGLSNAADSAWLDASVINVTIYR